MGYSRSDRMIVLAVLNNLKGGIRYHHSRYEENEKFDHKVWFAIGLMFVINGAGDKHEVFRCRD